MVFVIFREGRSQDHKVQERATYNYIDPYAPDPYLSRALAAYQKRGALANLPPYASGYNGYNPYGNILRNDNQRAPKIYIY